ncbi:MAG: hypothetical protein EOO00_05980 [Chitinophagaceae bacterium]|nr:MAG: hypothetical protein EOO00_05980 [Chitinophagaceae bacterium]
MKKIFTISAILIVTLSVLAGCSKRGYDSGSDEDYWLSRERGEVVYSDSYCPYYVVETSYGYTIVRSSSNFTPFEGSIVYGDFSRRGYRDFYNRTDGTLVRGEVTDYWLTYGDAQYLIDNMCY